MAIPLAKTSKTTRWIDKHVRPLIASLAAQGHIDPAEGMELLAGLDGLRDLVNFVEQHGDAIKRAAR